MNIKRHVYADLMKWRRSLSRRPLILRGARQVGKTHLIREFAREFEGFHEFNFQKNVELCRVFKSTNDPLQILVQLGLLSGRKIDIKKDLIFFDEIQDCPEALNSLKFFSEDLPGAFLVSAGSLLGIYLSSSSFPVGKVEFLNLFPLSFFEFLRYTRSDAFVQELSRLSAENNSFHEALIQDFHQYMILGGLPKIHEVFAETQDYNRARQEQENLLISYRSDFAKYAGPVDALKILSVFENIPRQLAKDNKKFQFSLLKAGGRFAHYSAAIDWLVSAGLCFKLPIISNVEIPLKVNSEENMFKLYFFDVGLLSALSDLPVGAFVQSQDLFKTFKGALTENFFMQEFTANNPEKLYCWQGKISDVDFLFQRGRDIFPVEIKSGESGRLKSLQVFFDKYSPQWKTRCSLRPLEIREDNHMRSIPLYLASLV